MKIINLLDGAEVEMESILAIYTGPLQDLDNDKPLQPEIFEKSIHDRILPREIASRLAESGFYVWPGNHYALPLTEALGLEPHGTLRIGAVHYNTVDEVERLMAALRRIFA